MLKPFTLRLVEAEAAVQFDILNLIVTNGWYSYSLTVRASLRVLSSFQLRICRDQETCAQSEGLGLAKAFSLEKLLKLVLIFYRAFLKIRM